MPPHLHPRSTATSTLFAGTLLASFVVVGIPHIFPCPRPRKGYADAEIQFDAEGKPVRRKTRQDAADSSSVPLVKGQDSSDLNQAVVQQQNRSLRKGLAQPKNIEEEAALFRELQREAEILEKQSRECPVPKPRGMLGRFLGFQDERIVDGADEKS